ncbi:MFS transporter [Devosia sp.]|uniref:MFS transporter n=1 Tax=Devosia sp. TaxID=1871048 RepID=UPI002FC7AC93
MPTDVASGDAGARFTQFGVIGGGVFFTIQGLANPFFALYATELGASTFAVGLMVTLKALLPIVIAMPAGQLIDSIGPMKMLKFGSWFLLASLVCTVFATGIPLLALSQVLIGASVIIMASSFQVLVAHGDRESRNNAIKKYSMWMSGGGMLGPIVGGLIASAFAVPNDGYRAAFVASLIACVLFMVALFWLSTRYPHPDASHVRVRDAFSPAGIVSSYKRGIGLAGSRPVQFGLTGTFLVMYIQALYMSFLPLYLDQNGFATFLIALTISLKGLAGMLSRFALSGLMNRYSLELILLSAGTIAAVGVVLTPVAVGNPVTMLLLAAAIGGAVGVNLPVSIMIMVDAVGESERGKLMGLRLLANRFSQVLSPAMFGILGQLFGLTAAFYSGGAVLVATVLGFSAFTVHRGPLKAPEKSGEPAE